MLCKDDGYMEFVSCGAKNVEGCKPKELVDKSKPYPECCLQNFDCGGVIKQF